MKLQSYHILFRFFSFLSDKTNGFSLFVKYKVMLGTLIMSLTAASCANKNNTAAPDTDKKDSVDEQITCYEVAAPDSIDEPDTIPQPPVLPVITLVEPIIEPDPEPTCYMPAVTCYDIAVIDDTIPYPKPPKEMVYGTVDTPPVSPFGELSDFVEWVQKTLRYPEEYGDICVQGRVVLKFIVDTDGQVVDVAVVRGIDAKLDKEAVRAVKASPKWQPGSHYGNSVRVSVTIPVRFSL